MGGGGGASHSKKKIAGDKFYLLVKKHVSLAIFQLEVDVDLRLQTSCCHLLLVSLVDFSSMHRGALKLV